MRAKAGSLGAGSNASQDLAFRKQCAAHAVPQLCPPVKITFQPSEKGHVKCKANPNPSNPALFRCAVRGSPQPTSRTALAAPRRGETPCDPTPRRSFVLFFFEALASTQLKPSGTILGRTTQRTRGARHSEESSQSLGYLPTRM